jgi:hypothetical protein
VAWRKGSPDPATAELRRYAAEYARVAAWDGWAAERLAAVESWLAMLAGAGSDPEVAALFTSFARSDREIWERRRGVA